MKKLLLIVIITCFLSACSKESTVVIAANATPEGMNQEFYEDSLEIAQLINTKITSGEKMSESDQRKVESFLNNVTAKSPSEAKVYGYISVTYPIYKTYIITNDKKEKEKIMSMYLSDYKNLSEILEVK